MIWAASCFGQWSATPYLKAGKYSQFIHRPLMPEMTAERIARLYREGASQKELMTEFHMAHAKVRGILVAMGEKIRTSAPGRKRTLSAEQDAAILADYLAGMDPRDLEDKYGVSRGLVRKSLRRGGIERLRRPKHRRRADPTLPKCARCKMLLSEAKEGGKAPNGKQDWCGWCLEDVERKRQREASPRRVRAH